MTRRLAVVLPVALALAAVLAPSRRTLAVAR